MNKMKRKRMKGSAFVHWCKNQRQLAVEQVEECYVCGDPGRHEKCTQLRLEHGVSNLASAG